ncbi:MAG TPA: XylR N-terminal domain-containing protein, partial [bacterium]
MRVEDLNLKELLELDPKAGTVHFAGQRALIFDAVSQGLLRKELVESFGESTARGILSRYGYIHGRRLAETMKNKFDWNSDEDWQRAGARIFALQGLFALDPNGPKVFGPEGGSWLVSYEAEQQLLLKGRSENSVCWTL